MIDWVRINELRDEIGVEDFDEVVELFLGEVEERLETLNNEKASSELEEDMHFLKGSALNLGFDQLAALCHDGEEAARSGNTTTCLESIRAVYAESKSEFLSKLGTTQPT